MLHRRFLGEDYTVGSLYVDGEYFCDTLEDTDRGLTQTMSPKEIGRIKAAHGTAIPAGVYKLTVNMSQAEKRILPGLPDVPGFTEILIRRRTSKNGGSGCILVGESKADGKVLNSALYEKKLLEMLSVALDENLIWVINGIDGINRTDGTNIII